MGMMERWHSSLFIFNDVERMDGRNILMNDISIDADIRGHGKRHGNK